MRRAIFILLLFVAVCVHGAEPFLAWSPVTIDMDGAPLDTVPYYEIYERDTLRTVTYDTFFVVTMASSERLSFRARACIAGRPCSEFSRTVSTRVVSFMPAYAVEDTALYFGEVGVDLLVVLYPHPDDSLFIAYEGGAEFIRWQTFLDFNGDGWLSLSDLARLGLLYILQYTDPGLFMLKSAGGKINLSDIALFGDMYHGSATREWSSVGSGN